MSEPSTDQAAQRERAPRMARLRAMCSSFPALEGAPGIEPWEPDVLDEWAAGPDGESGARHAAAFVLELWDSRARWRVGVFEFVVAMRQWDEQNRQAFLAWAKTPWWS